MKRTAPPPAPPRVPYPQTPSTSYAWLRAHGVSVSDLSRHYQVHRNTLVDLLRGKQKGHRGQAHRGAIILGLKPDPEATH